MFAKKTSFWLLILGIFIFSAIFLFKVKDEMVDFKVNYEAGKRIKSSDALYYRIKKEGDYQHYQFKYPPFSALLYLPLTYLPLAVAKAIWYLIILLSAGFLLYTSQRLLNHERKSSFLLPVLTFFILVKFFLRELQLGQTNALITSILILMIWLIARAENPSSFSREIIAGLLWGLSTVLKPYALIFFPYFLIKKKWRTLSFGILFLVFAFLAPSLFYGIKGNFHTHLEWKSSLSKSTLILLGSEGNISQDNISIIAFFMKWTGNLKTSFLLYTAAIIVLAFFLLIIFRKGLKINHASVLDSSILLILIPLISPLGWDYTLLSSALGVMIVLHSFYKYTKFWRSILIINFLVISLSLFNILGRKLYTSFMSWSIITVNFLILIVYISYLRLKRHG